MLGAGVKSPQDPAQGAQKSESPAAMKQTSISDWVVKAGLSLGRLTWVIALRSAQSAQKFAKHAAWLNGQATHG